MLWDFIGKQKIEGEIQVNVPTKTDQPKLVATCHVKIGRTEKIKLLPPRKIKGSKATSKELTIYSIQVEEINQHKGVSKID